MPKRNAHNASHHPLTAIDVFIGKKIKNIRKEIFQTAAEFGENFNLSARQIYMIEAGKRHLHPRELLAICEYLDVVPIIFYYDYPNNAEHHKNMTENVLFLNNYKHLFL